MWWLKRRLVSEGAPPSKRVGVHGLGNQRPETQKINPKPDTLNPSPKHVFVLGFFPTKVSLPELCDSETHGWGKETLKI